MSEELNPTANQGAEAQKPAAPADLTQACL